MKPFERAEADHSKIDHIIADMQNSDEPDIKKFLNEFKTPRALRIAILEMMEGEIYLNDKYQVVKKTAETIGEGWPKMYHLSIKRLDKESIHDWRDLQEIKNMIVGPEHEAIELYPAESRKVDGANQYHLYVLMTDKIRFPFGFQERMVSENSIGGSKQRSFKDVIDGHKP